MKRGLQGRLVKRSTASEPFEAFIPAPLPPRPAVAFDAHLQRQLGVADRALGQLDGVGALLPDPSLLLYFYVRKEALLSSQIEGTQSSISDLLLFESAEVPGVPLEDVREVSNYVAALMHGIELLRAGLPVSLRLIRELHRVLLSKGRGSQADPGEFRRSQNWVGGTRPGNALYVPPPPEELLPCLDALERYLHGSPEPAPPLVKAALAHVQVETIHPFLDGNGRVGRLLITLLLIAEGAIQQPLLYLSLYFKQHRQTYYELLQRVRLEGEWEAWLRFFLDGVVETAENATEAARRILERFRADAVKVQQLGRARASANRLFELLQRKPLVTLQAARRELGVTLPTASSAMNHLVEIGVVREVTGKQRNRVFAYQDYLNILSEGTEPLR